MTLSENMNANIEYSDIEHTYHNLNKKEINHFELMGNEIIKSIKTHGFGVLPKSDFRIS